jgi:hypothetical protein
LSILSLSLIINLSDVYACKCKPKASLEKEFDNHDAVFLGQVTEFKSAGLIRPGFNIVRFEPTKIYKGKRHLPNLGIITIFTPDIEKDCGLTFTKGSDYVVFASGNPAFLRVDSCSLSNIQEKSKETLIKLETLSKED